MAGFPKYSAATFSFWQHQLFRIFPNSFVRFIQKNIKSFSWCSASIVSILFLLTFWFSATGSRLYKIPNVDLLFGIFFKDILIPMLSVLVAWYIIASKYVPDRINEYYFLNSLPISSKTIFFYVVLLDYFRYSWVPGAFVVLSFGLKSFTPLSFLIRLGILTFLTFGIVIIGNVLMQLFFSANKKKQGGFGYPAKMQPMILFLVIFIFTIIQLSWIIFPTLNTGFIFWSIVILFTLFMFLFAVYSLSIFKKWQRSNSCFKFEGNKKREGKINYLRAERISKFLFFLKPNHLFIKNLVKIGIEKNTFSSGILTLIFILISYLIAMNNENVTDSISVLLGLFGIYAFLFSIRAIYQTGPELESPNLIFSLPLKKHHFYLSVFTLSMLGLVLIFSIQTIFLLFSGSGIFNTFGFWWRALFLSIIFLTIALNFAFSSYPEMKIAQKRFFNYLLILTVVTVSLYKFRYGIAVAFMLFSFLQLKRLKLFDVS